MLLEGDDPRLYQTRVLNGRLHLDIKPGTLTKDGNGDCIYLTDKGCSIHSYAPKMCKGFDCRVFFQRYDRAERRRRIKVKPLLKEVFEAGKQRLEEK